MNEQFSNYCVSHHGKKNDERKPCMDIEWRESIVIRMSADNRGRRIGICVCIYLCVISAHTTSLTAHHWPQDMMMNSRKDYHFNANKKKNDININASQ